MDTKGKVRRTLFPKNDYKSVTTFDDQSNVLSLKYVGKEQQVSLDFSCMEDGNPDPNITYVERTSKTDDGKESFTFKVRTKNVCMHPTTPCEIHDLNADVTYDLSPLMRSKQDWVAYDTRKGESNRRYHISICKPLSPSSTKFECENSKSAVCQTNENSKESFSLGIINKGIELQPQDQNSLIIRYYNGSKCNGKENYRSSVVFRCYDIELGPKLIDQHDGCHFMFEWLTPVACPNKNIVKKAHECRITDSVSGHTFDLNPLHNETSDIKIITNDKTFKINICGQNGLISGCGDQNKKLVSVCEDNDHKENSKSLAFTSESKLEYNEGVLMMKYEGNKCTNEANYSTTILFMCDHMKGLGAPEFFPSTILSHNNKCEYIFTWKTKLACAALEETECVVSDKDGNIYDLSSLSLPDGDYDIRPDTTTKYLLNVCRSHVTPFSEAACPEKAAVCYGNLVESRGWKYNNVGQVGQGPRIDERSKNIILEYEMGDICKESTSKAHISTRIEIACEEDTFRSQPEFTFQKGCTHNFFWRHNAACPRNELSHKATAEENCRVKDPINNHEFDLNVLTRKNGGYEFRDDKGTTYAVNICGPVQDGKAAGMTTKYKNNTKAMSRGKYNNIVKLNSLNQLYMNYTDGDECVQGRAYSTYIRFICSPLRDNPTIFVERDVKYSVNPSCTIFVNFFTSLACPKTVSCRVPKSEINLSPLMDYEKDYNIQMSDKQNAERIILNVCKPLTSIPHRDGCPTTSAICVGNSKGEYQVNNLINSSIV